MDPRETTGNAANPASGASDQHLQPGIRHVQAYPNPLRAFAAEQPEPAGLAVATPEAPTGVVATASPQPMLGSSTTGSLRELVGLVVHPGTPRDMPSPAALEIRPVTAQLIEAGPPPCPTKSAAEVFLKRKAAYEKRHQPPAARGRETTSEWHSSAAAGPREHNADFIVLPTPRPVSGVVEAVSKDLQRAAGSSSVELRSTSDVTYLRIVAPTQQESARLVEAVERQNDLYTSDEQAGTTGLFVEPPNHVGAHFTIVLDVNRAAKAARPRVELSPEEGPGEFDLVGQAQEYRDGLLPALQKALFECGRLHTGLGLRVHLGYYVLRRWPKGKRTFDFDAFRGLAKNPRSLGRLNTDIGNNELAKTIMNFLAEPDCPFVPINGQKLAGSGAEPRYSFEAGSKEGRFEASIISTHGPQILDSEQPELFQMQRTRLYRHDSTFVELDITNISPGKKLDWKVEAIAARREEKQSAMLRQYFDAAKVQIQEAGSHGYAYAEVTLPSDQKLNHAFEMVAVNTVYSYSWKDTGFILDVTIKRRWNGMADMLARRQPAVTISLRVYHGHWDGGKPHSSGHIWGSQLEGLFGDGGVAGGDAGQPRQGQDKVEELVEMIGHIRDALKGVDGLGELVT
ncbi:hypothetical protein GGR56DRAFT_689606 [Xylariaceae sp. FL0804]|nr:hypothetical protein GGR56DRAFT_689606 [Xylariaceae sp. FL0804]